LLHRLFSRFYFSKEKKKPLYQTIKMRFSTVAASAVLIGFAAALPNYAQDTVVYETTLVTVTSCSPDKTDCPGKPTATPVEYPTITEYPTTTEYPVTSEYPTTTEYPEVSSTPCTTTDIVVPTHYPNSTVTYPPHEPSYPAEPEYPEEPEHPEYPEEPEYPTNPEPEYPTQPEYPPYVPSGTGVPYPPANTSSPSTPSSPPEYEGAAVKMGASLIAVAGAAVFALLA
jgi:hypothetical protein